MTYIVSIVFTVSLYSGLGKPKPSTPNRQASEQLLLIVVDISSKTTQR